MKLKHTLLLACLSAVPLHAQQSAAQNEVRKAEATSGESTDTAKIEAKIEFAAPVTKAKPPQSTRKPGPPAPQQEQKPVAYIGVLTREVSPELRSQFSLPDGFGLVVDEVMPDSPAKAAGLKQHDILVKFEEQQLVNMEQLMSLVRAKQKGDVVNLAVITGGKATTVPVTLGERMVAAGEPRAQHGFGGWPQVFMDRAGNNSYTPQLAQPFQGGNANPMGDFREHLERFQKEMRQFQEQIQDWAKNGSKGPMPQPPKFNTPGNPAQGDQSSSSHSANGQSSSNSSSSSSSGGQAGGGAPLPPMPLPPGGGNAQQFNHIESHATVNITRRDDAGEYTLKREHGNTTFTVRPNHGKEQSWPINTDAERNAVPQEFRDKLRMMDGPGSGIHIQINPGQGGGNTGGNKPTAPRPQGKSTSA